MSQRQPFLSPLPSHVATSVNPIASASVIAPTGYAAVHDYAPMGWRLVPLRRGTKRPEGLDWGKQEVIWTPREGHSGGIGLCHAYSGTCAVDIDDWDAAAAYLAEQGVDLEAIYYGVDAVRLSSNRPGHAKLIYKVSSPKPSAKHVTKRREVLNFRCATANGKTVQDVLPPSVYPDTGQPYVWETDFRNPPNLPVALLQVWDRLLNKHK